MGLARVAQIGDSAMFVCLFFCVVSNSFFDVLRLPRFLAAMGCSCNSTRGTSVTTGGGDWGMIGTPLWSHLGSHLMCVHVHMYIIHTYA